MTLVRYNPLNDFVPSTFGTLIENALRDSNTKADSFQPAVDIFKNETEYELHFYVPGMKKEDFEINVEKNVLEVSGERTLSDEAKESLKKRESRYGKFSRKFTLSEEVNQEMIGAAYADGILVIKLPIIEKKETKNVITVK